MKDNYIILNNARWTDSIHTHPEIPIDSPLKLYVTKNNGVDRRTKEYKTLVKNRPNIMIYHMISAEAEVQGVPKSLPVLLLV